MIYERTADDNEKSVIKMTKEKSESESESESETRYKGMRMCDCIMIVCVLIQDCNCGNCYVNQLWNMFVSDKNINNSKSDQITL